MPETKMPRGFAVAPEMREGDHVWYGPQPYQREFVPDGTQAVLTEAMMITLRMWKLYDGRRKDIAIPLERVSTADADINALRAWDGNPVQLATNLQRALADMGWRLTLTPPTKPRGVWARFFCRR